MIEKKLGKTLPLAALFQGGTVEHLADLLRRQIEVTSWTPLVEIQTGGAKHPLFFVHPVGGNILCYLDLARHLGPEQPFYGFQARGLAEKQAFHTQVEAMATYYIDTMRTVQPEGPYRLGGWSMGGVVAFEMAQQLRRQGQEIVLLALIDASAPKGGRRRAKQDDVALLLTFAQDLGLSLEDLLLPPKHHPSLELNEPLAYILERAKMANKIPSETEFTQIQYLFNIFQVNNQALQDYVPRPYRGQITLFKAGEIRPEDDRRPTLGWDALTTEGVEVHECPGTHFTMIREPHVQILAEQLRTSLMLSSFYQQEELAMGVTT
jgi:thioesterase domain-containing protein